MTNEFPGIELLINNGNPTLRSPNTPFELGMWSTRDTLMDVEVYSRFIRNIERQFRHTRFYKKYKGELMQMGMDRCQTLGNVTSEMATIEMHHNLLTLFDLTLIITEYLLNTRGYVTTYEVINLLKQEHRNNRIQLVMLSLTSHQLYHNTEEFFIHPKMCFGKWWEFLDIYKAGITIDIAFKIIRYIDDTIKYDGTQDAGLLNLRQNLIDWSNYNEYHYNRNIGNMPN